MRSDARKRQFPEPRILTEAETNEVAIGYLGWAIDALYGGDRDLALSWIQSAIRQVS